MQCKKVYSWRLGAFLNGDETVGGGVEVYYSKSLASLKHEPLKCET